MQTKVDYIRGYKHIKPSNKRGYYVYTDFSPFSGSLVDFMIKFNKGLTMPDGYAYLPYQKFEIGDNCATFKELELLKA